MVAIHNWKDVPLWPHQRDAVQMVLDYYASPAPARKEGCVVRMPTGTGKTGVIATLAITTSKASHYLILAPSDTLRSQLAREVASRFWTKVEADTAQFPTFVKKFVGSEVEKVLNDAEKHESSVLVTTVQSLCTIREKQNERYERLRAHITHVVFDEGHREPAPTWAEAVRSLGKPTVLFTATPYRNDYAVFSFDEDFVFSFSLPAALEQRFVRRVVFEELDAEASTKELVERAVALADSAQDDEGLPDGARVIFRCSDQNRIKTVADLLAEDGQDFIAVHDKHRGKVPRFHKKVPDPQSHQARFWIHQHKLTEGFDDPRFAVLAFVDAATNGRELVQQIGRIIRNPGQKGEQRAVVVCRKGDRQEAMWRRYLAFEKDGAKAFDFRDLVDKAMESQGAARYVDCDFRERFDPFADGFQRELRFPRSANVFVKKDAFKWDTFRGAMRRDWGARNRTVANEFNDTVTLATGDGEELEAQVHLQLFIAHRNSPKLIERYFFEFDLGYTVAVLLDEYLFYYDTQAAVPRYFEKKLRPVSPAKLRKLFGQGSRAASISLRNADLGPTAPRRRSISAQNLADTSPGLADHSHFTSTIRGHVPDGKDDRRGRYLGFSRGRLSDDPVWEFSLDDYLNWVEEGFLALTDPERVPDPLFDRYAAHMETPADPAPRYLLLDVGEEERTYVLRGNGDPLRFDEPGTVIDADGKGGISANGRHFLISVKFDPTREAYELTAPAFDEAYRLTAEAERGEFRRGPAAQYNYSQNFSVVTATPWVVYMNHHFLGPRADMSRLAEGLLSTLTCVQRLGTPHCTSEKGAPNSATALGWHAESLFAAVDDAGANDVLGNALREFDVLVCDDVGRNESADFIALHSEEPRVAFIHAKARDQELSASKFMDVCGQVTKNLEYVSPYAAREPPNAHLWDGPWNGGTIGKVDRRIRRAPPGWQGKEVVERLRAIIQNPLARREVWILYGIGFKKALFASEMIKEAPSPEAVQFYYLLEATWNAVQQVGAQLRVFCPNP